MTGSPESPLALGFSAETWKSLLGQIPRHVIKSDFDRCRNFPVYPNLRQGPNDRKVSGSDSRDVPAIIRAAAYERARSFDEHDAADSLELIEDRAQGYHLLFQKLPISPAPGIVFVGGCGYGADLLGARLTWPEAEIIGVSLGQTPTPEMMEQAGQGTYFGEASILEALFCLQRQHRGIDLALFNNVYSAELFHPWLYAFLGELLPVGGYAWNDPGGGIILRPGLMETAGFQTVRLSFDPGDPLAALWRKI